MHNMDFTCKRVGLFMKEVLKSNSIKIKYIFVLLAAVLVMSTTAYAMFAYANSDAGKLQILKALVFGEVIILLLMAEEIYGVIRKSFKFKSIPVIMDEEVFISRKIFNAISNGIIVIDNKGKARIINQCLCQMFGIEENQVINSDLCSLVNGMDCRNDYKSLLLLLLESIKTQKEFSCKEMEFTVNSEACCFVVSIQLLGSKNKSPAGAFAVVRDITQNKKLEQQLFHAERLVTAGQMAAELAHEIKNPICSIKGLVQLLEKKYCIKESEYLFVIMSEIDRINTLVQGFLTLAQEWPRLEKTSVNGIIEEIAPLLESNARFKDIDINIDMQKGMPFIYSDSKSIKQVIINIVQNGIDALNRNGRIDIVVWHDKTNEIIRMEFRDNGTGINSEYLDKIFDPFFTTKDTGTGLGLAISRKIIESHCGRLSAYNNSEGGAVFVVELPVI